MGVPGGIGTTLRELAGIGSVASAHVHAGTPGLRTAVEEFVGRASSDLHVDLFRVDTKSIVHGIAGRGEDLTLSVLADTDSAGGKLARRLEQAATHWDELGGDPLKQHAKTLSRDGGAEAIVATDIADGNAKRRVELFAHFRGAPARALADVHAARGLDELSAAVDRAAAQGVVFNDPRTGAAHASTAVELLAGGSGPIRIATKAFDSAQLAQVLAKRAGSDTVELVTHTIPKAQKRLLRDAGVIVSKIDERDARRAGLELHGTLIDAGDHALLGSLFLDNRVLYGSRGRTSREAAVVLSGDAATNASRVWDQLVGPLRDLD
jgi:hypothetical protein